ncbi:hypothetical protein CSC70_05480 [Pseudoxanthomonas kalamensis DSM 18571]|uniref:DUF3999 domain-containing protein n=1 Tax=Pseudoxanthomonas kalamensis TaxID=289483 RepID=UPI0013914FCD|nr:DUF3999 domain-containing protein [Pseudoxanthomonas kalamensis]KAF1711362.1 hypothetical protein CSC70_05480 [Pseudoxanthomonas kalamensis DSM 18571]
MKKILMAALLWVPWLAVAGVRDDYARQWPLQLDDTVAGAYRVELTPEIYRQARSPRLDDVTVANAAGVEVPSALFPAGQSPLLPASTREVPWFPLPAAVPDSGADVASISEIAADGSLRRVLMQQPAGDDAAGEVLVDLSRVQEPVAALRVEWDPQQAPFERRFRVVASDDLKHWSIAQDEARLLDLDNNGQRLLQRRIALSEPVRARYLRLVPLDEARPPLRLSGLQAELQARAEAPAWQWRELSGQRVEEDGVVVYRYELDGRFPIEQADVLLPGNNSREWTLSARDDTDAAWQSVAGPWLAFQLQESGGADRSPPQSLRGRLRHRYWQLQTRTPVNDAVPVLRLGYRPETLVFVAEGQVPFAVFAGSARTVRGEAAVASLLQALRTQRGQAWQPVAAVPGQAQDAAGEAALQPLPPARDWKSWLLWALLLCGAALVAGFAFSLLRKPNGES